jgi:hypothetical protein
MIDRVAFFTPDIGSVELDTVTAVFVSPYA